MLISASVGTSGLCTACRNTHVMLPSTRHIQQHQRAVRVSAGNSQGGVEAVSALSNELGGRLNFVDGLMSQDGGLRLLQEGQNTLQSAEGVLENVNELELSTVLQQLAGLISAAWGAITSPLDIFGPDMGFVNVVFILAFLLLAYNIVVQAPRQ